jgi:pimeloyl-ACP methyl ester carboxylesterase
MVPTILVPGTWGDRQAWWRQGSPFWQAAVQAGVTLLNGDDPYNWTTEVDGLLGRNRDWETAGHALRWYGAAKGHTTVNVIAHSHGGQVALYGAAGGLQIDTLVTVATPVRWDIEPVMTKARVKITRWIHLRSDRSDWWQWFGEILDGRLAWPGSARDFPQANQNIIEPGVGHSGLLDPAVWTARSWWQWLQ